MWWLCNQLILRSRVADKLSRVCRFATNYIETLGTDLLFLNISADPVQPRLPMREAELALLRESEVDFMALAQNSSEGRREAYAWHNVKSVRDIEAVYNLGLTFFVCFLQALTLHRPRGAPPPPLPSQTQHAPLIWNASARKAGF